MRAALWIAVVPLTIAAVWVFFWRHHLKRLEVVKPGVLYRVAQPTEFGFRHVMQHYHVRTAVSVRLEDPPLYTGLYDPGGPDGEIESRYVPRIGLDHRHWPLGEELYWPWFTPWLFEEFFRLMDEPAHWPVVVHCLGGRHRTGTFVALFQLEYNRRPVEEVLQEMYSHKFGPPAAIQEHNLRTYLPRPRPSDEQWARLRTGLFPQDGSQTAAPKDYAELVRRIKSASADDALRLRVQRYIAEDQPFALCLAERLIDRPEHPLAAEATRLAAKSLQGGQDAQTLASAAAVLADYGAPDQQQLLMQLLKSEQDSPVPTSRYTAIVAGISNRYTPNRIVFLAALLGDTRERPEPHARQFRYCDTAAARLMSILNEPFYTLYPGRAGWDMAVANARTWLEAHPHQCAMTTLLPPTGRNQVRTGTNQEIDGSNVLR